MDDVLGTFEGVAGAPQSQNQDLVAEYLPDTAIRKRVVDAFQQLAPKPGSGWKLDLSRNGTTVRMDDNWQRLVRKMYMPTETEPDRESINGELIEINSADRQITILPKGSNRPLKVTYQDAMDVRREPHLQEGYEAACYQRNPSPGKPARLDQDIVDRQF
ncbi:MAG: hypothetical protein SFV51_24905 [Bryobacteraceae bacterium]|nr:hypothetical protein [Bryobacteraceae bacterium]